MLMLVVISYEEEKQRDGWQFGRGLFLERDNVRSNEKREWGEECLNEGFARFLIIYMSVRIAVWKMRCLSSVPERIWTISSSQTVEERSDPVHVDAAIRTVLKEGVHFCSLLKLGQNIRNCKFLFPSSSFIALNWCSPETKLHISN